MSESWQSAWVEILPDFKNFAGSANSQMSSILGSAGTAGGIAAGRNMGAGMLGGIKGIAGPLIAVVAALGIGKLIGDVIGSGIRYGLESVDLASDLEQSTGAVRSVFKEQSQIIEDFAAGAATNVGLAKTSYQTFATVVGAQLKNLGLPIDTIAGKTDDLIVLGADLAAQFGGPTSDAVNALSSLLRGERDPIERYGVGIKQADINARLAAAGLGELTGKAKKQAEIQATLAILTEQTADAQGTFARESDTLAGAQQRLQARLKDTKTEFGESLLPAFTLAAGVANDTLLPALDRVLGAVGPKLKTALEEVKPDVEALTEKVEPLAEAFLLAAVEEGLPAIIDGLNDFVDGVDSFVSGFQAVDEAVRTATGGVKGLWDVIFLAPDMIAVLKFFSDSIFDFAVDVGISLARATISFTSFIGDVQRNIRNAGQNFRQAGRDLIQQFVNGIISMMGIVGAAVGNVMDWAAGFFPHSPAERGPFSGAGWTAVGTAGAALADEFAGGFNSREPLKVGSIASGLSGMGVASRARQEPVPTDLSDSTIEKLARTMTGYLRNQSRQG